MLPHLHNGWQVDQAILSEEERVVVIRSAKETTCNTVLALFTLLASVISHYPQWSSRLTCTFHFSYMHVCVPVGHTPPPPPPTNQGFIWGGGGHSFIPPPWKLSAPPWRFQPLKMNTAHYTHTHPKCLPTYFCSPPWGFS